MNTRQQNLDEIGRLSRRSENDLLRQVEENLSAPTWPQRLMAWVIVGGLVGWAILTGMAI